MARKAKKADTNPYAKDKAKALAKRKVEKAKTSKSKTKKKSAKK